MIKSIEFAGFQSTSLSRGKTVQCGEAVSDGGLSIHFPLTREDKILHIVYNICNLSIHFPLTREDNRQINVRFYRQLSIHFPLTREDTAVGMSYVYCLLSIHFPLTREDIIFFLSRYCIRSFNPLPSHEGRHDNAR